MSSTTTENKPNGASPNGGVTKKQLEALSANFFARVQILDRDGAHRQIDCSDKKHPKKNDTKSVYFDKARIDALFAANPGSDGLKIYFGVHDHKIFPMPDDVAPHYDNKLMVVLVATAGGKDMLKDDTETTTMAAKSLLTASAGGDGSGEGLGMDQGKLCPPSANC
nr:hypothetical protein [uncultured Mucilaginibacter sp.]